MPAQRLLMLSLLLSLSPCVKAQTDPLVQVLQHRHCPQCRLSDADLVHAQLNDANLRGAQLQRANLSQARLDGADLSNSNLSHTNLRGASLRGADLRGSRLYGTDLRDADLNGAQLDPQALEQQTRACDCHGLLSEEGIGAIEVMAVQRPLQALQPR